jgi:HTH-type transcriptional repressor of NAD biosynthesis genes
MNKTVGMYGGKFAVLHLGHVYAMTVASTLVEELHVIVSYDEEFEKENLFKNCKLPHVGYKQRVRWWKEITKDMPHVHVHGVYETNNNEFASWQAGADGIKKSIGKPITHIFSSESHYGEFFNKLYPDAEHVVIDEERSRYNISATKLRTEGVYSNWELLPEVVRRHYVKKVVVVGTESCGKSTLVRNLATLYNTNYVEEHGRTFYEELGSYDTFEEDYLKIAYRQKYHEEQGLKNANKLLFIDTEANVTHRFLKDYHDIGYFSKIGATLWNIAESQKYDLWLFLEPDVEWVDDGTRTLGKQEQRDSGNEALKHLLVVHGIEYITVKGNYNERLNIALENINKLVD